MCGIVGYIGHQPVIPIILEGLKQIEYRGYDSAGITFYTSNGFKRVRATGALDQLEKKIQTDKTSSLDIGIGHTRWATHGEPNEINAHPQKDGLLHIVHNGTIENVLELKKQFPHDYQSQTDTEVIAHIINTFYSKKPDLFSAVLKTTPLLKGNYSFLTVCENSNKQMVGCKNGPPLAIGVNANKEFFISSDLPYLTQKTQQIYILENKEIFVIENGKCQFFSFDGQPIKKEIQNIKWSSEVVEKKGFPHFMLKEIFDQPHSVHAAIQEFFPTDPKPLKEFQKKVSQSQKLHIIACGSSYYAGLYGKFVMEHLARIPVEVSLASEFQYSQPLIQKNDPILFISQSGETADILSCVNKAKEFQSYCVALCNVKNSSLDRMSDASFFMQAGTEVAVASTKAFTASLVSLLLLALKLSSKQKIEHDNTLSDIKKLPDFINQVLSQTDNLKTFSNKLKPFKSFLFLGRGPHYPMALEGALKMKELAYVHAEGYPFGEMKHGPLALVDHDVLIVGLLSSSKTYLSKNIINLEEIKARKGNIVTVGASHEEVKNLSLHHIQIPHTSFLISPILEVIPLQLLAYHFSILKGFNVDRPRNLAKSVTVE